MNTKLRSPNFLLTLLLFYFSHYCSATQQSNLLNNFLDKLDGDPANKYQILDVLDKKVQQISSLEEQMERLKEELKEVRERITVREKKVDQVRNPPFTFQCAWRPWDDSDSIITFKRLSK